MAQTRDIKKKIDSVKKTQQITRAMKMIAGVHFNRLEKTLIKSRPYAKEVFRIIKNVTVRNNAIKDKLLQKNGKKKEKVLLIAILSDKGLCGGFNTSIIKKVFLAKEKYKQVDLYLIGKKGESIFRRQGFNIIKFFHHNTRDLNADFFNSVAEEIVALYEEYDAVDILYTEYKSVIRREIRYEQVLPVKEIEVEIELEQEDEKKFVIDYFYELTEESVLRNLVFEFIEVKVANALLESAVSETSARMTAMDAATKNADDLINKLTLVYNRVRQAGITNEIIEISSGAEALA